MPIYEFKCPKCGQLYELLIKFEEKELQKCTKCDVKLESCISAGTFDLRGGGWYSPGMQ